MAGVTGALLGRGGHAEGCQGQTSEPLHLLNYTDSPSVVHGRLGPARDPVRRLLHQQCFHNKIMMLFAVYIM